MTLPHVILILTKTQLEATLTHVHHRYRGQNHRHLYPSSQWVYDYTAVHWIGIEGISAIAGHISDSSGCKNTGDGGCMNTAAGAESAKLTCVSLENSASPCFGAKNQNLRQALIHKEYPYHPGKCLQQVIHNVAMLWRKNLQESMHSLELMKPTLIIPIPPSSWPWCLQLTLLSLPCFCQGLRQLRWARQLETSRESLKKKGYQRWHLKWQWWLASLKLTPSLLLKMDGWKTALLLGRPFFTGYVSFREGRFLLSVGSWMCLALVSWSQHNKFGSMPTFRNGFQTWLWWRCFNNLMASYQEACFQDANPYKSDSSIKEIIAGLWRNIKTYTKTCKIQQTLSELILQIQTYWDFVQTTSLNI